METNTENYLDIESMRKQLETLKKKLDEQQIVNDKLVRKAMSNKMSWIMKFLWTELFVLLPFAVLAFCNLKSMVPGMSWYPVIAILVFMLACIVIDLYVNNTSENDWKSENLISTGMKLVKMKRLRWMQVAINLPIVFILFVWLFYDLEFEGKDAMVCGSVVGGVIGMAIGIGVLIRMNRTNDELIRQIRELKEEADD
ncbi:MAG: hypothetical protein ACI3ZB_11270 [Prevotella sp.]